jgi:putative ABC transport system permease protein
MTNFTLALRSLRKNPGHAVVAVVTLALAVGGATAIFSVLNAVVLRPLPYQDSDRIVVIRDSFMPRLPEFSVSPGRFLEWQKRTRAFDLVAASESANLNLTGAGEPERLRATLVSPELFTLLGVRPLLGRTFTAAEDAPGADAVIVLSEALWRGQFGGSSAVVGRTILIDDKPVTVIGVMPDAFGFPSTLTQAWKPLALTADERRRYGSHYIAVLAHLKPGVSFEAARDDLARASREIEPIDPGNTGWTTLMFPFLDYAIRNVKAGIWVLSGAVGLVLLIACANIANLLLARGVGRQRELGVRAALGATRLRLVRQMLAENVMLGLFGSGVGLAFAAAALRTVVASPTTNLPRAQTIGLDGPTVVFAMALAGLTPLIFGLLPAIQISRTDLRELLAQGGRSGASGLRARTRGALIVAEVALAVMLVAASTLLMRSFSRLMDVPAGFQSDRQLVIGLSLPGVRYATDPQRELFWSTLASRASHLTGVESAAVTQSVPLVNDYVSSFDIPGKTSTDEAQMPSTNFYAVSPAYFQTMGIPLLRGRGIENTDGPGTPRVVVISATLAAKYFPTENPLGNQLRVHQGPGNAFGEIVGVVGDVKQYGLDRDTTLQVYEPIRQHAYFSGMNLIVRSAVAPEGVTASVRGLLKELDPNLPIANARTLASIVASSVGPRRFTTTLLATFAVVALLLATIGVYGLVSFAVGQRTQEIGIRMALGAQRANVLRLVFAHGLGLTLIGVGLGLVAGSWATRWLATELFDVSAHDPLAFGVAPTVLVIAAAAACYWPARRAMKVDPVTALRQQ